MPRIVLYELCECRRSNAERRNGSECDRDDREQRQCAFQEEICQREAIETLIYIYELRGINSLSGVVAEFTGEDAETAALAQRPS